MGDSGRNNGTRSGETLGTGDADTNPDGVGERDALGTRNRPDGTSGARGRGEMRRGGDGEDSSSDEPYAKRDCIARRGATKSGAGDGERKSGVGG